MSDGMFASAWHRCSAWSHGGPVLSSGTLIVLELLLVAGLVIGFGARELLSLRRYRKRQRAEEAAKAKEP